MVSLHLVHMLGKVWVGSQTIQEAAFSGLALGIGVEAGSGVGVREWDICLNWGLPNKCIEIMC